jgi:hypothetical protein
MFKKRSITEVESDETKKCGIYCQKSGDDSTISGFH